MLEGFRLILAAASVILFIIFFTLLIWRFYCYKRTRSVTVESTPRPMNNFGSLQDGIAKLQQGTSPSLHRQPDRSPDPRRGGSSSNYHVFKRWGSEKPLFSWADHPSLITDAVENGWSRFGFAAYVGSPSGRSSLLGWCAGGDPERGFDTDISWEVCQGSADFMQKIRLNSGFKRFYYVSSSSSAAASVIRTGLPLPGPPLGNSAFPQEAYFEITILCCRGRGCEELDQMANGKVKESEKAKLIQERCGEKGGSESSVHTGGSVDDGGVNGVIGNVEELKLGGKDGYGGSEGVLLSLGLSTGGSLPLKLPGRFPGSVGFNSNGSVFLDGTELVFQSEKTTWGRPNKVIGCGFDPRHKKVFYTLDGELVHVIQCKSEEYGTPLYPTMAANDDVQVLVNFGQSAFAYAPANSHRTPNPCFIGPLVKSPTLGLEDSKELFSMGRIDSQWLSRNSIKGTIVLPNGTHYPAAADFDEESEADLFEIVLESSGRSPFGPL